MTATGRAAVEGPDYWGSAETISYNEAKDQVAFDAGQGGEATLNRSSGIGVQPKTARGKHFLYIRKTGEIRGDGVMSIDGRN
jgi:hypothetical protein